MRKLLYITILIFTTLISVWGAGNFLGVCWSKKKILSEKDLLHKAILSFLDGFPYSTESDIEYKTKHRPKKIINYKSINEFLKKNPECCAVRDLTKHSTHVSARVQDIPFLMKLSGYALYVVSIKSKTFYITQGGDVRFVEDTSWFWVDRCGKISPVPLKYYVG